MFRLIRPQFVVPATLIASNVPESEATYNAVTTYAKDADVRGAADPNLHTVFRSVQAGNQNHPLTDPAWWVKVGPTNRWAMWDQLNGTQTVRADVVEVEVQLTDVIDSLAMLNIEAGSIHVVMTDGATVVYDRTISLASDDPIVDWYEYFFAPIDRINDVVLSDLPPYYNAKLTITFTDTGNSVRVGNVVLGQSRLVGTTMSGASVGIKDYSRKETDDFGNYIVVERAFSKRANASVMMDNSLIDPTLRLLAEIRAQPTVFVLSDAFGATIVFGYYKDANLELTYAHNSVMSIEIEGLT